MVAMSGPPSSHTDVLQRIEAGMRTTATLSREVTRLPGFVVAIAAGAAGPGLAVAVPVDDEPRDLDAALAALEATFARHGLPATIEYLAERHPGLAQAATERGWRTTGEAPVMTLTASARAPEGHGARVVRFLHADGEDDLIDFLRQQDRAYGGDGSALGWLPIFRAGLASGRIVAAVLEREGRSVAGASVQIGAGVGELAGVWTRSEERRRGHAGALCGTLLTYVLAGDVDLCWLSAAPGATTLYERLGFRQVAEQRNLEGRLRVNGSLDQRVIRRR